MNSGCNAGFDDEFSKTRAGVILVELIQFIWRPEKGREWGEKKKETRSCGEV